MEDERLLVELRNASLCNAMENDGVGLHNTLSSILENKATQEEEETRLNVTLKPTLHE